MNWAKFAPLGKRGFDGGNPDAPYCMTPVVHYLREANEQTFLIIQVEEPHAIEEAEAILSVPDLHMLMLRPGDFSVLTGIPGKFAHPTVTAALDAIVRAAKNAGKNWAATCGSVEAAKRYVDMGARLVFHGCDIVFVKNGLEQVRGEMIKKLGARFGGGDGGPSGGSYLEAK